MILIKRPIVWYFIIYALGVLAGLRFGKPLFLVVILVLIPVSAIGIRRHKSSQYLMILAAFIILVTGIYKGNQVFYEQRNGIIEEQKGVERSGILASLTEGAFEYQGKLITYQGPDIMVFIPTAMGDELTPGDEISVTGILQPLQPPQNPGGYHEMIYYKLKNAEYILEAERINIINKNKSPIYRFRYQAEKYTEFQIGKILPEKEAGLITAMITGNKSGTDKDIRKLYQDSGIAHIIAISGLHIQILSELIVKILNKIIGKRKAYGSAVLLIWIFCFFTGGSVSTIRAALLLTIRAAASLVGCRYEEGTGIALAAWLLLLWKPLYIFDAGFQLSFSACLGIYYGNRLFDQLFFIPEKYRRPLASGFGVTVCSLPITLFHYYKFSPYSVILNLLVIPLMNPILWLALISLFLGMFWSAAGTFFMGLVYFILRSYETLCRYIMQLPFHLLITGAPPLMSVIFFYIFIALQIRKNSFIPIFSFENKMRKITFLLSVGLWIGLRLLPCLTLLSVGQGDCAVLSSMGKNYLIDSGPQYTKTVKPYLNYRGIHTIDGVFLSHMDADHSAGVLELLQDPDFIVKKVYIPDQKIHDSQMEELQALAGDRLVRIGQGDRMSWPGITIHCLSPDPEETYSDENSASMVLKIHLMGTDVLMCGDIDQETEQKLLTEDLEASIIKIAHHGSRTASSDAFLKRCKAQEAFISCSEDNSYGHPHEETLAALTACSIHYGISFRSGGLEIRPWGFRYFAEDFRKRWMRGP